MTFGRDAMALGVAAVVTALLGGLFILPAVYPPRVAMGYAEGTILSYDVQTTKYGGTHDWFEVKLDRGEVIHVSGGTGWCLATGPASGRCSGAS